MVYNTAYFAKRIATGATSGTLVGGLSCDSSGQVFIPNVRLGTVDLSGVDIGVSVLSADVINAASGLIVSKVSLQTQISGSDWASTCSGSAGYADFGDVSGALTNYTQYSVVSGAITAATSGLVGYDVVSGACTAYTSSMVRAADISGHTARIASLSGDYAGNAGYASEAGVAYGWHTDQSGGFNIYLVAPLQSGAKVIYDGMSSFLGSTDQFHSGQTIWVGGLITPGTISGATINAGTLVATISGSAWSATTSGAPFATYADISGALTAGTSGVIRANDISGYATQLYVSGFITAAYVSGFVNTVSGYATLANVSGYPTTVEANISSAIAGYSGFITANYVSGFAHMNDISSMVVANSISSMVVANSISGLGLWTSAVQTIYEVAAAGWDSCSGADFPAGATTTASSAIDVSSPSLTAVAMVTGQAVAISVFVPPNANRVSQRLVARHYTSGPTATFTTYQRTIGGSWSGILTTTISGTLLYRTTVVSSDIAATLPISAGAVNQFVVGVACSGTVYLNDYQLNFS
jgi:hypothetical protein